MACHLVGAKPLSEPMLDYCQLEPREQTSVESWAKVMQFYSSFLFPPDVELYFPLEYQYKHLTQCSIIGQYVTFTE